SPPPQTGFRDDHCLQTSVGLVPLSDLTGSYQGFSGGLYDERQNARPADLDRRVLSAADRVRRRDMSGTVSPNGQVGFLRIGHSIASQELTRFIDIALHDPAFHGITVINGAKGGCALECASGRGVERDEYWVRWVAGAVRSAGLSPAQVQVAWLQE